jgi:hypothetical protein
MLCLMVVILSDHLLAFVAALMVKNRFHATRRVKSVASDWYLLFQLGWIPETIGQAF